MITVDSNPFLDTTPNFRGARYEMPEPVDPTAPKMTAGFGAGMSARDFISPTAGRAVPSHAANGEIRARAAAATAARFYRNTPRRVAPTVAGKEQGLLFQLQRGAAK